MATKAYTGAGATISVGPLTGNLTQVMQTSSITITPPKWKYEDITNLGSPSYGVGVISESLPSVVDPGEVAAQGIFLANDAGLGVLYTYFASGAEVNVAIQLKPQTSAGQSTTGNAYIFQGFVSSMPTPDAISADKTVTYKLDIKLNSALSVTAGS